MIRTYLFLIMLLFAVGQVGCDDKGDNYLEGSLVTNYHISYDAVRARLYSSGMSVEYMSDTVEGVAALRITINTADVVLAAGKTYDLVQYGSVTRFDELGSLPELQSGEVTLNSFSETEGSTVAGEFHAIFVTEEGVTMNLRGGFSAKLEVVPI